MPQLEQLTQADLINKIRRGLGEPTIKVELENESIIDCIHQAKQKFQKFADGQASVDTYFAMYATSGSDEYDLPFGTVEVIKVSFINVNDTTSINTLFTTANIMWNSGVYQFLNNSSNFSFLYVDYLTRSSLEMVERQIPSTYVHEYSPMYNKLKIVPTPSSIGYFLVNAYILEGSNFDSWTQSENDKKSYGNLWIYEYSLALSKIRLGMIRRKFENFNSIGNIGIGLDGSALIQEGTEEKRELEEKLRLEETYTGYGILMR